MEPINYRIRSFDLTPESIRTTRIDIIGCGSIGSYTALCLAKIGAERMTLHDAENVAPENIGPQLFGPNDIDRPKVSALNVHLQTLTGITAQTCAELVTSRSTLFGSIVISCVDSMKAREEILSACKSTARYFIDARIGAERALIYTTDLHDRQSLARYRTTLYSDAQASTDPCTAKATAYTAFLVGGHIAKNVTDLLGRDARAPVIQWNIRANDYASKMLAN